MALMAQKDKALKKSHKEEGVLLHNGRRFAVGLTWLTAEDDIDVKLAKDRAKKMEADFYALRTTVSSQQGFGSLEMGHKGGMPSAASLASDMLVGEWHGVFTADNGWWYIAVHADSIAPDGDLLFFSEEAAFQHFQERAQNYKWPRSYAPENWNLSDANSSVTLEKILDDSDRAAVLKPANTNAVFGGAKQKSFAFLVFGIFVTFLIVAVIAPALFSAERPDLNDIVRNRIFVPTTILTPPKIIDEAALDKVDLTVLTGVKPSLIFLACSTSFSRIMQPLPGWKLRGISCDSSTQTNPTISALWNKDTGSLDTIKPFLAKFPNDATVVFDGDKEINVRTGTMDLNQVVAPLNLGEREAIIRSLYDRFANLGQLSIEDVRPPAPKPKEGIEGLTEQEPPPPPPPYMTLKLSTMTPPNVLGSYFDVSGLKVQNIQWDADTGVWTYESEIQYESKALREYYAYQQRMQQKQ